MYMYAEKIYTYLRIEFRLILGTPNFIINFYRHCTTTFEVSNRTQSQYRKYMRSSSTTWEISLHLPAPQYTTQTSYLADNRQGQVMKCLLHRHLCLPISKGPQSIQKRVNRLIKIREKLFQRAICTCKKKDVSLHVHCPVSFKIEHLRLKEGLYSFLLGFQVA